MSNMYDFDTHVDRRRSDAVKWHVKENELPMWVADMDFKAAPEIIKALEARVAHGVFGYTDVPDEWYDAYIGWWRRRHGFQIEKDWLIFCTGVVPAISSVVRKLTTPNENVVVQTPVYNIFFNSIVNNGCRPLESRLLYDGENYEMDLADLERKLADPQTTLMILCNPHNPVGKIWSAEDLRKVGELCAKHHVTVISDEIHCDLTVPGRDYIPFASVSETNKRISVTCIAPTKTFNLAGLQTSAVVVPDEALRNKVRRALNTDEVAEPNAFACIAAVAAFTKGEAWLEELRGYLLENRRIAEAFAREQIPQIKILKGEATYLLWIDCTALPLRGRELAAAVRKESGLFLSAGSAYGQGGEAFLRMNIACPKETLLDGMERLKKAVNVILGKTE